MAIALQTKLDAVNKMLERVWESPVSSLETSGVSSVALAKRVLDESIRAVLAKGWAFNVEDNVTLTPDANGNINVPSNALEVDTMDEENLDVVVRGSRLYNKEDHTFAFTRSLKCRVIYLFDFEELPQAARTYISCVAARVFKDAWEQRVPPSTADAEEQLALVAFEQHEAITGDHNFLTGSWSVGNILRRF